MDTHLSEADEPASPIAELRETVQETLKARGVLGAIKAQLRAAVFTAIDKEQRDAGIHMANEKVVELNSTEEGRIVLALMNDFLECYGLQSTRSVLEAEVDVGAQDALSKEKLLEAFAVDGTVVENDVPILLHLVRAKQWERQAESKNRAEDPSEVSLSGATAPSGDGSDKLAKENTDMQVEVKVAEQQQPSAAGQREDATEEAHAQDPPQSPQATGDANMSSRLADSASYDYEDDYEDDNDFERPISEESDIEVDIADDGLISQSQSFEDSGFLSLSGNHGNESGSINQLSISASIVQDSMDLSAQDSQALEGYDFIEVAQKPSPKQGD